MRADLATCGWIGAALFAISLCCPSESQADRLALREIVQEQCLVDWTSHHDPAPCLQVVLTGTSPPDRGYAVLADRKGGAHFLLIPVETISGIEESPALADAGAPNYFALAWELRGLLADSARRPVARGLVGLAINPPWARSQDQLHIHLECMSPSVIHALDEASSGLGADWTPVQIAGAHFHGRRLMGDRLEQNPFEILAKHPPDPHRTPADYTLLVGGRQYREGPGFALLAGTERAAELLLDSSCAAAGETP